MARVEIRDLGIRFSLNRRDKPTLRRTLLHPFLRNEQPEFWAIRHVDLALEDGDILGISGPNGVGKSTLLRSITGIYQPDEGQIITEGRVSLLAIGAGFIQDLTGIENIYQNGAVFGFSEEEIDELVPKIVEFSGIGDFVHQPIRKYSSGMVSRLGFAVAINLDPDILLIDEVMAVGDAAFKKKSEKAVMDLIHRPGKIVVIVSHSQAELDRICNRQFQMSRQPPDSK